MNKEDIEATVWRLQHFINDGVGYDVPKDIRALLAHIADLEEEIDDLKARAPHPVEGDGSDLPVDTVVVDKNGDAWQHYETSGWEPIGGCCCTHHALPDDGVPYTIVWEPKEDS